jgi:hypothetical protein
MDTGSLVKLLPIGTALAGYAGGIFSEPLKSAIKRRQDKTALRRSLYAEIAANYESALFTRLEFASKPNSTGLPALDKLLRREVFDEAMKNPILFNQLYESNTIVQFYLALKLAAEKTGSEQNMALERLLTLTKTSMGHRRIDRSQLRRNSILVGEFETTFQKRMRLFYHRISTRNVKPGNGCFPPESLPHKIVAMLRGHP